MADPADVAVLLDHRKSGAPAPVNNVRPLGRAATRWSDYVGTASADDAEVRIGAPSLYELSGLDRAYWRILGMDLVLHPRSPNVVVYAAARTDPAWSTGDETPDMNLLQVTAFPLDDPEQVNAFLTEAFETVQVRLLVREHRDALLIPAPPVAALLEPTA